MDKTKSNGLTGRERFFNEKEIIVSKTDPQGRIIYANKTFMDISGYDETELLGQPHSLIRHPHMPRSVFKLLWDTISSGHEIFAYVINTCKTGDHYWVLAHVTPSFDIQNNIVGYHSSRRYARRDVLDQVIIPLYERVIQEEESHRNSKEGLQHGFNLLKSIIQEKGMGYDEFVFSLQR